MKILLTGGTGLIGRHLIPRLLELGHQLTVSTRNPERAKARLDPRVTLWRGFEGQNNLDGFDAVINLAGFELAAAGVAGFYGNSFQEICFQVILNRLVPFDCTDRVGRTYLSVQGNGEVQ